MNATSSPASYRKELIPRMSRTHITNETYALKACKTFYLLVITVPGFSIGNDFYMP